MECALPPGASHSTSAARLKAFLSAESKSMSVISTPLFPFLSFSQWQPKSSFSGSYSPFFFPVLPYVKWFGILLSPWWIFSLSSMFLKSSSLSVWLQTKDNAQRIVSKLQNKKVLPSFFTHRACFMWIIYICVCVYVYLCYHDLNFMLCGQNIVFKEKHFNDL